MELLGVVPADAIALRIYSAPVAASTVVSLCAWLVAALAAAVGLWRIRAVGSSSSKPDAGVRSALVDDGKQRLRPLPSPAVDEPPAEPAEPASPSEPSTPSKVRFTAYYGVVDGGDDGVVDGVTKSADRDNEHDGGLLSCDVGAESESESERTTLPRRTASSMRRSTTPLPLAAAASWEEREMAVRRRGDLGWYRHLDMAALDGSVVRLWDGGAVAASPRARARRARAGLELHLSL